MGQMSPLSRRWLLRGLAATGVSALLNPQLASSRQTRVLKKPMRSTGEELPAIGLGSWMVLAISELGSTFGQSNLASEIVWFS